MANWVSAIQNSTVVVQDQLHSILLYKQALYYYNPEPFLFCAHCRGLCTQSLTQLNHLIGLAIRIEESLVIVKDILLLKCRYD